MAPARPPNPEPPASGRGPPADERGAASEPTGGGRAVPAGPARGGGLRRLGYRVLASVALALALAGVVLPGLPATPFLLLAAWAAARGSPALAARIETHPRLGPLLRNWRERRVVPLRAKILAVLSMAASFALLFRSGAPPPVLAGVCLVLVSVATFLLTRPSR